MAPMRCNDAIAMIAELMQKPPRRTTLDRAREGAHATCQHVQRCALSSSRLDGQQFLFAAGHDVWVHISPYIEQVLNPTLYALPGILFSRSTRVDHLLFSCACA